MSLHDCPLADSQTRRSILHMLTAATHVPAYAKDLMNRAGRAAFCLSSCLMNVKLSAMLVWQWILTVGWCMLSEFKEVLLVH